MSGFGQSCCAAAGSSVKRSSNQGDFCRASISRLRPHTGSSKHASSPNLAEAHFNDRLSTENRTQKILGSSLREFNPPQFRIQQRACPQQNRGLGFLKVGYVQTLLKEAKRYELLDSQQCVVFRGFYQLSHKLSSINRLFTSLSMLPVRVRRARLRTAPCAMHPANFPTANSWSATWLTGTL